MDRQLQMIRENRSPQWGTYVNHCVFQYKRLSLFDRRSIRNIVSTYFFCHDPERCIAPHVAGRPVIHLAIPHRRQTTLA